MEQVTIGPVSAKVLPDKGGAIVIDRLDELDCPLPALARPLHPANPFLDWRIDEHVKGVRAILERVSRAPPDDHASAFAGRGQDDATGDAVDVIRVRQAGMPVGLNVFATAAQERFHHPVVPGIAPFLSHFDGAALTLHAPRDLERQLLVPHAPTQTIRQTASDVTPTASILAIDRDKVDHGSTV